MNSAATTILAGMVLMLGACGRPLSEDQGEVGSPRRNQGTRRMFDKQVLMQIEPCERRAIAVVKCLSMSIIDPDTRSQRALIECAIVQTGTGEPPATLELSRFSQDKYLMEPGRLYLIAACDDGEWQPAWSLAGAIEVAKEDAGRRLADAVMQFQAYERD